MGQQTAPGLYATEGVELVLTDLLAGSLTGAKLHLWKTPFAPTPEKVAADYAAAEADFTGYGAVTLTWSAVGVDAGGNPTALSDRAFFQATDDVTPCTVGGAWVTHDVTGPPAVHTVLEFYQFQTPVPMITGLAFCGVVIGVQMPGTPGYAIVDN